MSVKPEITGVNPQTCDSEAKVLYFEIELVRLVRPKRISRLFSQLKQKLKITRKNRKKTKISNGKGLINQLFPAFKVNVELTFWKHTVNKPTLSHFVPKITH